MARSPRQDWHDCSRWALRAAAGIETHPPCHLPQGMIRETIVRGRLQGLIFHHLGGFRGASRALGAELAALLRRRARYLMFVHLHQHRLQTKLTTALSDAGIRTVLLKGAALGPLVYPDPALRSTNDLDLLVSLRDRQRATEVLDQLGGVEHDLFPTRPESRAAYHERVFRFEPAPRLTLIVELHTGFAQSFRHPIDYDEWLARAVPLGDAYRLDDADQLVHLAIHTARELFLGPLKQLVDAHAWIQHRPPDWERVLQVAQTAGADRMVFELLRLCRDYLDTPIPASVLARCAPPWPVRALFQRLHRPEAGRLCRRGVTQPMLELTTLLPLLSTPRQRGVFVGRYAAQRWADARRGT